MKKTFSLIALLFAFVIHLNAQTTKAKILKKITDNRIDNTNSTNLYSPGNKSKGKNANARIASAGISVTNIGKAGNAFGTAFGAKTNLYTDPRLNTITMVH